MSNLAKTVQTVEKAKADRAAAEKIGRLPSKPIPLPAQPEEGEVNEQGYPYQPRGIRPGTSDQVTPLKHVNMYLHAFTEDNIQQGIEYVKTQGDDGVPPVFMTVDTRGEWSVDAENLFWQASDGSTGRLQVVPKEQVPDFIRKKWYQQDLPSGIASLHKYLCTKYLGISRSALKKFIDKQKPWQMIRNKRTKGKERLSLMAKRPFSYLEIDIADMVSFQQTVGAEDYRYLLVVVDNFSGFCMAEVQSNKESPTTLKNLKLILAAIKAIGYKPPMMLRSDQGPEFQGEGWDALDRKYKWRRELTKNYPSVALNGKSKHSKDIAV